MEHLTFQLKKPQNMSTNQELSNKIDGAIYVPISKNQSVKPIIENGITYIPVRKAPEGKVYKNPTLPTGNVSPINRNG